MSEEVKHPVRATEKTLKLMSFLKKNDGAGVTEAAEQLDIGKSAVHSHLSTLAKHDYVVKEDGEYHLSLRFLDLGGYKRNQMKLFQVAEPQVKNLAENTGELVNLATEEHGQCVYLSISKGDQAVGLDTYVGMRAGLHNTALGKAILAHLPEDRVHEIVDQQGLEATTQNTITKRDELFSELAEIRENDIAFDREERLSGLRCIAAPITYEDNTVAGAISVAGPTSRFRDERFETEIPNQVRNAANVIELNIAHS